MARGTGGLQDRPTGGRGLKSPRASVRIATGGLAPMIAPLCQTVDRVEPTLTLVGLRLAYDLLRARES